MTNFTAGLIIYVIATIVISAAMWLIGPMIGFFVGSGICWGVWLYCRRVAERQQIEKQAAEFAKAHESAFREYAEMIKRARNG